MRSKKKRERREDKLGHLEALSYGDSHPRPMQSGHICILRAGGEHLILSFSEAKPSKPLKAVALREQCGGSYSRSQVPTRAMGREDGALFNRINHEKKPPGVLTGIHGE